MSKKPAELPGHHVGDVLLYRMLQAHNGRVSTLSAARRYKPSQLARLIFERLNEAQRTHADRVDLQALTWQESERRYVWQVEKTWRFGEGRALLGNTKSRVSPPPSLFGDS